MNPALSNSVYISVQVRHRFSAPGLEGKGFNTDHGAESSIPAARARSATPMSALSFNTNKPLPELPDEPSDIDTDVSVQEFEGYLDILAYLQRDLPSKPQSGRTTPLPQTQAIIRPAPKEEEWISSRPQSRPSTSCAASEEELNRLRDRSVSGVLSRSTSGMTRKTVTPMSSLESDAELLGGNNRAPAAAAAAAATLAPRIEEVSEPDTSLSDLTPKRQSTIAPTGLCFHCGRDPTGKDVAEVTGSPITIVGVSEFKDCNENNTDARKATGPTITAKDEQGRQYTLYTATSYYTTVGKTEEHHQNNNEVIRNTTEPCSNCSSPLGRPPNPDPYHSGNSPSDRLPKCATNGKIAHGHEVDISRDFENINPLDGSTGPSPYSRPSNPDPYAAANSPSNQLGHGDRMLNKGEGEGEGGGVEVDSSFWKDPEGVILVYQGVEMNGKEVYYGNDINYLGSFYDEEEGSSGLGSRRDSTADLVGTGSGLAMIPEVVSSDDMWDDEVFGARPR